MLKNIDKKTKNAVAKVYFVIKLTSSSMKSLFLGSLLSVAEMIIEAKAPGKLIFAGEWAFFMQIVIPKCFTRTSTRTSIDVLACPSYSPSIGFY